MRARTRICFGKHLQKMRLLPRLRLHKACIPLLQQYRQCVTQRLYLLKARFQLRQLVGSELPHTATGNASVVTLAQDHGQLIQRKPHGKRATDQPYAVQRLSGVQPVAIVRTIRRRQYALTLIVPERVGADACQLRKFAGTIGIL